MSVWLMAMVSVDGKLTGTDGALPIFGSELDAARLVESRTRADAVILGGATVRQEDLPPRVPDEAAARRVADGRPAQPAVVIVTRRMNVPLDGRILGAADQQRYVATTDRAPANLRTQAGNAGIRVLALGEERVDPAGLVAALAADGHRKLVVEGGGGVNAAFLEAGVVDEVHVTFAPTLLGGRATPSLMTGDGLPQVDRIRLELLEATPCDTGEIFARYRVLPAGAKTRTDAG